MKKREKKREVVGKNSNLRTTANNFSTICLFLFPFIFFYEKERWSSCKPPSYYIFVYRRGGRSVSRPALGNSIIQQFTCGPVFL